VSDIGDKDFDSYHRSLFVANIHGDYGIEFAQAREQEGERGIVDEQYLPRLEKGGLDFEFYTVGGDHRIFTQDDDFTRGTLRSIDHAYAELTLESERCAIVRTTADIRAARQRGQKAFLLTIEGAAPIQNDLSLLRNFYRLGLRSVIFTWFRSNPSADGVGERRNGGLTNFGRDVVLEMNRLGMVIDICQCAPQTVSDILELSGDPVIASHSNASGLYPHVRNLTDDQLKCLAQRGGLIGLTSFPAHVGKGRVTIENYLDHFDYVRDLVGIDHIAVGLNIVVHKSAKAQNFYENSDIEYSDLWLPGLEDVDEVPNITRGLLKRGYSDEEIRKIMGGNVMRLLEQVIDKSTAIDD
jgi:membrane dipeptidase